MWEMLLKMTGATLQYVVITAVLWIVCHKKIRHSAWLRVLVGLIFGACSVAANHLGVEYVVMRLNVRDIGPMSAGLFFSPTSGVIAGLIGGIERLLAGEIWGIGSFTTVACSVSTCLAGLLSAILHKWVYGSRRPSAPHAFFLGALVEVFHMYSVLIMRLNEIQAAFYVVRVAALPMILFTAVGLALCSLVIRKLSGEQSDLGLGLPEEKLPLATLIQRVLLIVTAVLFLFNFLITWQSGTRMARDSAVDSLGAMWFNASRIYTESGGDNDKLTEHLCEYNNVDFTFVVNDGQDLKMIFVGKENPIDPEDVQPLQNLTESEVQSVTLKTRFGTPMLCFTDTIENGPVLTIMRTVERVYLERDNQMIENTLSDILLFAVFYVLVMLVSDKLVVRNLKRVNISLGKITAGNVNEEVWVRTSSEFSELSDDINQTVSTLRGYIRDAETKMEEELKFAASIQNSALPRNFRLLYGNLDLYALMAPARQVGGDFYDFFFIAPYRLCLVIADVSGKGVPASLFMMRAKTSIKYYARSGNSPAELLVNVNSTLCEDNDSDMFVTVWLGILDLNTGVMRCVNAGHEYPVLMRSDGEYELMKRRHGLVLGVFENVRLEEYEIHFEQGDRFFVYTDGVPEAMNEKKEQYGTSRMTEQLNRLKNRDQQQLLEGMLQDIRNYSGKAEQFDDITMLGFTYRQ